MEIILKTNSKDRIKLKLLVYVSNRNPSLFYEDILFK